MKRNLRLAPLGLVACLSLSPGFAAVPYLVDDIDPRFLSEGSNPNDFLAIGGRAVFVAGDESTLYSTAGVPGDPVELVTEAPRRIAGPVAVGARAYFTSCGSNACGLYATNGSPAGTVRLVRWPSAGFTKLEAAAPEGLPRTLVIAGSGGGNVLWRTDGTPAGTRKVGMSARSPRELTAFRGKGWFFADLSDAFGALFSTDGLPGGTRRIGATNGGTRLTSLGSRLVYFAGRELWSTDGTAAGTVRLAAYDNLPFAQEPMVVAGTRAFYFAYGESTQLWATDGTVAGTRMLSTSAVDPALAAVGGKVAFLKYDPERGAELWASDGTPAGTRRVKDICPGGCTGFRRFGPTVSGRLWFAADNGVRGSEPWLSDLSAAGTRPLRDLCPGSCSSDPRGWFVAENRVYFVGFDSRFESVLYVSDGTAAGTKAVVSTPEFVDRVNAAALGGPKIVFSGSDATHGREPWISDGTAAGTRLLADLDSDNVQGSFPHRFFAAGDRAYFFADDGIHGPELWSSDADAAGTRLVYEFEPGATSSQPSELLAERAGNRLVLFANESFSAPLRILGSDGSPEGTESVLPEGVEADRRRETAGDKVFFVAEDAEHGAELWSTDGTATGTLRLSDFVPPSPFRGTAIQPALFALGGRAVAPVLSLLGGEELWISDGTPAGTRPLDEVYPFLEAPLAAAESPVAMLGGRSWFVSAPPGGGTLSLWRTDLTAGGTAAVSPLDLSQAGVGGWTLVPLAGRMLVFGPATSLGRALWSSDGTAAGTHLIVAASISENLPPVEFAGRLWFLDRDFGDLWSTDGTATGTLRALDDQGNSIQPTALAVISGRLAMVTRRGPYESDGTPAGTHSIELPGALDSSGTEGIGVGGRILFRWNDHVHGPELWALGSE